MAVWLNRAGKYSEFESKFIQDSRIYATWDNFRVDLREVKEWEQLVKELAHRGPDQKRKTVLAWAGQLWAFAKEMAKGDLVVLPLKRQRAMQVGEITGDYHYDPGAQDPYYHWRPVKWIGEAVPRENFSKDLLNSLGSALTICRVKRNNAEARFEAMRKNGWKPESIQAIAKSEIAAAEAEDGVEADLEEAASDQIARLISARFKGHSLTRLVEAVLKAQGYTTYRSPEGADGGADILAGAGPLGFGTPRLCVEVKSENAPIDRPTVDKLLGAVTKFGAQEGLFVSWSGFKSNVQKELAASFFRVRLWSQAELLEQLFVHYDRLDADLRAELPLKRVWMVAAQEDE